MSVLKILKLLCVLIDSLLEANSLFLSSRKPPDSPLTFLMKKKNKNLDDKLQQFGI